MHVVCSFSMMMKRLVLPESCFTPRKKLFSLSLVVAVYLVIFALLLHNNSIYVPQFKSFLDPSCSSLRSPPSPSSSGDKTMEGNVSGIQHTIPSIDSTQNVKNESLHVGEHRFPKKTREDGGPVVTSSDSTGDGNITHGNMEVKSLKNSSFSTEIHNVGNFSWEKQGDLIEKNNVSLIHHGSSQPEKKKKTGLYKDCNIYDGKWVRDDSKPLYPLGSCSHIDKAFYCHLNGRLDTGYIKWRWQPNRCDIPRLNVTDFLERLHGQRLVFVGDSLNRNMWESMVCIFRHSIRNKKRVYEISGRTDFKKKGIYSFRFEDYNCSVDFVVSPFLVRPSSFRGKNGTFETLRLDLMDRSIGTSLDADIIVFNTGHWWSHEKTSKGEDYYQEGKRVHPKLEILDAYRRALTTWARWADKNIDANRTQIFFRGYSQTHFSGGQWNSGGQCHTETEPIFNETYLQRYPSKMRVVEQVIQKMKSPVVYMNISRLTDYRKDGHPSIYTRKYRSEEERKSAEGSQDCSHWCLPGVPDTWNELLYASLIQQGKGTWKS